MTPVAFGDAVKYGPRSLGPALRYGPRAVLLAREAKLRGALQKKSELHQLVAALRKRRLDTVVEIGTYRGGTLWLWCQLASPAATIASIDLPGGPFGGGYAAADLPRLRSYARKRQDLTLIRSDSHSPQTSARLSNVLAGSAIDFLFIDGDHSYEGVRRDYEMYSPLVAPGGLVAFHDVLPHTNEPTCEVDRFWRELKALPLKTRELVGDTSQEPRWGGIGLVFAD